MATPHENNNAAKYEVFCPSHLWSLLFWTIFYSLYSQLSAQSYQFSCSCLACSMKISLKKIIWRVLLHVPGSLVKEKQDTIARHTLSATLEHRDVGKQSSSRWLSPWNTALLGGHNSPLSSGKCLLSWNTVLKSCKVGKWRVIAAGRPQKQAAKWASKGLIGQLQWQSRGQCRDVSQNWSHTMHYIFCDEPYWLPSTLLVGLIWNTVLQLSLQTNLSANLCIMQSIIMKNWFHAEYFLIQ